MAETVNLNNFKSSGKGLNGSNPYSSKQPEMDYRGIFSIGREEITMDDIDAVDTTGKPILKNIFQLWDYHWYPEGFSSYFLVDDLYNQMGDMISNAPNGGEGPIGMTIRESQQTIKKTTKAITDTFGKAKGLINSVTKQKGQEEATDAVGNQTQKEKMFLDVPHMKVTEFQPQQEFGNFFEDLSQFLEIVEDIVLNDNSNGISRLDRIKYTFSDNGLSSILDKTIGLSPDDPLYIENIIKIPNFFYQNMVGGTYTAQYYMPYFNQATYLNAMGQNGWQSRSVKQQFLGNMISGIVDKIPGIGQFDIAGRPKFSLEGNNPLPDMVTTTFNLHNYNLDALIDNVKFIHSITAGAFWIQSRFTQNSSNLYDVEVPGRFRYYLCKANVKVEWVGKSRTLKADQIEAIQVMLPKISNPDAVSKFPDSYIVTIEFQSLMPNNFNTHLNYLIGDNEVRTGQFKEDKASSMITAVQTTMADDESINKQKYINSDRTGSTIPNRTSLGIG